MVRFFHIWLVFLKYGFLFFLLKLGIYRKPPNSFVRQFFEEAGGAFVKFGQLLAVRVDVLPKEFALEMMDLLDNIRPFPYHQVQETFVSELGATPEKIFKDFQKVPFASASFGQVHAAKLDDDTIVAVKVLRPGIEEDVKIDFIFVDILVFVGDILFKIRAMPWKEFAKEFKEWTLEELNYHTEAEHIERLTRESFKNPSVVIPKIYPHFSTKRILVQEYIEGVPLTRVLRGLKDGRLTREELLEMGIDIRLTPHLLTYEMLRQYFYFGFFHADPHPGNILLLQDNRIGLIDFGIMGNAVANQRDFIKLLLALTRYDMKEASYHMIHFAGADLQQLIESAFPASVDPKLIDDFMKLLADRFAASISGKVQQGRKDLVNMKTDHTTLWLQVLREAESYQIKLPKDMAVFFRALSIVSMMAREMDHSFKMLDAIKYFFTEHDESTFMNSELTGYKRINRYRAMEKLNSWLSFLVEKDPGMYKLVNKYIEKYNVTA